MKLLLLRLPTLYSVYQVANVGPVLFVVASYFLPKTRPQLEISVSFVVIIISMVAAFLMGYFYDYTSHVCLDLFNFFYLPSLNLVPELYNNSDKFHRLIF